jgi:large subunit ribosomal protein L15
MKIHELRPAPGSHRPRTRVGRGIAAGKGKTAGRGTKGQKARSGGSIPPWFEGGQTPLHMRIPKLRGFKPRFSVEYEVVNVGAIASLVELGAFEGGELPGGAKGSKSSKAAAPITVNQDILRAVGLVRTLDKPLKILGGGELSTPLFVVADSFSKSAIAKIEAAGGSVSILEVPAEARAALGVRPEAVATPAAEPAPEHAAEPAAEPVAAAESVGVVEPVEPAATEAPGTAEEGETGEAVPARRRTRARGAASEVLAASHEASSDEVVSDEASSDEGEASTESVDSAETTAELPDTTDTPADGV